MINSITLPFYSNSTKKGLLFNHMNKNVTANFPTLNHISQRLELTDNGKYFTDRYTVSLFYSGSFHVRMAATIRNKESNATDVISVEKITSPWERGNLMTNEINYITGDNDFFNNNDILNLDSSALALENDSSYFCLYMRDEQAIIDQQPGIYHQFADISANASLTIPEGYICFFMSPTDISFQDIPLLENNRFVIAKTKDVLLLAHNSTKCMLARLNDQASLHSLT